eukprot:Gb_09883 [translate_table: standard]
MRIEYMVLKVVEINVQITTADNWSCLWLDTAVEEPNCTKGQTSAESDCGSNIGSTLYFLVVTMSTTLIFMNLFVAGILDTITFGLLHENTVITPTNLTDFQKLWSDREFDQRGKGYIGLHKLRSFVIRLGTPLGRRHNAVALWYARIEWEALCFHIPNKGLPFKDLLETLTLYKIGSRRKTDNPALQVWCSNQNPGPHPRVSPKKALKTSSNTGGQQRVEAEDLGSSKENASQFIEAQRLAQWVRHAPSKISGFVQWPSLVVILPYDTLGDAPLGTLGGSLVGPREPDSRERLITRFFRRHREVSALDVRRDIGPSDERTADSPSLHIHIPSVRDPLMTRPLRRSFEKPWETTPLWIPYRSMSHRLHLVC